MQRAQAVFNAIQRDQQNSVFTRQGIQPLYQVLPQARILIVSQAPSKKAQQAMIFWHDPRP